MKKFILLLITLLCLASCKEEKSMFNIEYVLDYNVYYNQNPTPKTITVKGDETASAYTTSWEGTNSLHVLKHNGGKSWDLLDTIILRTTAPIEIVDFKRK